MNIQNLNNLVVDINDILKTIDRVSKVSYTSKNVISSHKLKDIKIQCVGKIIQYLDGLLNKIKERQKKYDDKYRKELLNRQEYAESQIEKIKTEFDTKIDKSKVEEVKNTISKIDYIKMYNCEPVKPIRVDKYNSTKIFLYLDSLDLVDRYKHMNEYMNKKIIFDIESISDVEIKNLKKLFDLIGNH